MKKILFCFLFVVFTGMAQDHEFQYRDFLQVNSIREKTQISLILWEHYLDNNLDSLKILAVKLLDEAYEKGDYLAIASGKRCLGSYWIRNGQIQKGINYLKEASLFYKRELKYKQLAETFSEMGNGYVLAGQSKNALYWYDRSMKIGKKSDDPTSSFLAEINLGKVYTDLGEYEKAKKIIEHYIQLAVKYKRKQAEANGWSRLAVVYQMKGDLKTAMNYFQKSKKIHLAGGSLIFASHAYNNQAIVLYEEGKMDSCLYYFQKALEIRKRCHNWAAIAESYFNLGEFYQLQHDYEKSIEAYKRSEEIALKKGLLAEQVDAMNARIGLYKLNKRYVEAYQLMDRYLQIKNSLLERDKQEATQSLEMDKILAEKEKEFKKMEKEQTDRMKANEIFVYAVCGIVLFVFLLLLFLQYLKTKKYE